ncbi:hypothetical protein JTB14_024583 [Gonioctena quinquepunctata]|nr:hypothetical protein JTB14_024583 [Gonioctena quinquepunctata]
MLVLSEHTSIPRGVIKWWLTRAMRASLDELDADSKTTTHGVPGVDLCDGSQYLTLYLDDANLVFRRINDYIKQKCLHAATVEEQDLNTYEDADFQYYKLRYLYYRCKHGLLAQPTSIINTLNNIISGDMASILLIQLHFGTVINHPTLPIFLHLPTAKNKLGLGQKTVIYRCYNMLYGGYITCNHPFPERYPNISYIQTYDPTFHMIRSQRKANITLSSIFGYYGSCSAYVLDQTTFMEKIFVTHPQHLNTIAATNMRLRVEFVADFDSYEETKDTLIGPQGADSTFSNLVEHQFVYVTKQDDNDTDDDRNDGGSITTLATFHGNWKEHIIQTGNSYLLNLSTARDSWKRVPSRDAARRMYDAEVKLKYFNEGSTKLLDYDRLKLLVGGRSLTQKQNDDDDLIHYIIDDDDHNHPLALTFKFQTLQIMHSIIPLKWYIQYVSIYLTAADKHDIVRRPHIVLMKAIAHLSYMRYEPDTITWTRRTTNDFGSLRISRMLTRQRRDRGRRWKILGTLDPQQVLTAIETPLHNAIGLFFSATHSNSNYIRNRLHKYVYYNVQYFPAYPITKARRSFKHWFRVRPEEPRRTNINDDDNDDTDDNEDIPHEDRPHEDRPHEDRPHEDGTHEDRPHEDTTPPPKLEQITLADSSQQQQRRRLLPRFTVAIRHMSSTRSGPSSPNILHSPPAPTENMLQPKRWTYSASEDRAILNFAIENINRIREASLWQKAVDDVAALRHRRLFGSISNAVVSLSTRPRLPAIPIPSFSGDLENWLEFRDTFESLVHNNVAISYIEKFHFLRGALQGEAQKVVGVVKVSAENYEVVWKLLCERYDDTPMLVLKVMKTDETAYIPTRASCYSAGCDLRTPKDFSIPARERLLVDSLLKIRLPPEVYGRIAPRSGLALKFGIDIFAGVIDQDYRGTIKILLYNSSSE